MHMTRSFDMNNRVEYCIDYKYIIMYRSLQSIFCHDQLIALYNARRLHTYTSISFSSSAYAMDKPINTNEVLQKQSIYEYDRISNRPNNFGKNSNALSWTIMRGFEADMSVYHNFLRIMPAEFIGGWNLIEEIRYVLLCHFLLHFLSGCLACPFDFS